MGLVKVSLFDFKNHSTGEYLFSEGLNCIVGGNGCGKTNLLDAIYYLSLTKSAFSKSDSESIRHGTSEFALKGEFSDKDNTENIRCRVSAEKRKEISCNGRAYEKFSDHIGKYPLVLMAPNDTDLVRGGAEVRRKLIDNILSQYDHSYLEKFLLYNKVLRQRNAALKTMSVQGRPDHTLLGAYDEKIITYSIDLYNSRNEFLKGFLPLFKEKYKMLSGGTEEVDVVYVSDCADSSFAKQFMGSRENDLALQRTTLGVHRDDYHFMLNGMKIKQIGSQGQQKTFVTALKIGQADQLKIQTGALPLVLMDDIFDKLDDFRISRLLEYIVSVASQVFITDARPDRTRQLLEENNISANFIALG